MYKIDGIDISQTIGFTADGDRTTVNSIEQPHDNAEVFSHTWPDGTVEYDLQRVPGDVARSFRIKGRFTANSEADYKAKKTALRTMVKKPYNTIFAGEIDETVNAKFDKFSQWERLTPIKGSTKILTKVTMEFKEVLGINLPTYGVYYGPSASIPVTAANVLSLNAAPFTNEIVVNTGTTNRFISIAIQQGKSITSVTDIDSLFGSVNYTLRGTVVINDITYNIYSLELALPYSTNHRHKFILS